MTHRFALCIVMAFALAACSAPSEPPSQPAPPAAAPAVQKAPFGTTKEGAAVEIYTLTNRNGMTAKVMTYGATLTELLVPDKTGTPGNIVLGFDTVEPYLAGVPYFGCTVGRVGNRIAKGAFTLNGKTYKLADEQRAESPARRPQGVRQGRVEGRGRAGEGRPGGEVHLPQPGRRGRLPGQPRRRGRLHAHRRQRAAPRLHGDDRQGHARQPDQPQLLQSGGRRHRDHPGPRDDDRLRRDDAGRRHAHPDRQAGAGEGYGLRLHDADGDRRAHREGADRPAGRVRPQLRAPEGKAEGGRGPELSRLPRA